MKVLLLNGSPHEFGCTYTALREAADALEREGIETDIFHIGASPVRGCIGCGACENVCPARPLTAIHIEGYQTHKIK